jgi:adenosylcobinamide kinase / adenosylcobinamide-phosphate guanylyltransferase
MLTLLLGGARSGKSALAVDIGRRHEGPVVFVATAEPFDDDLAARIARHRAERPAWPTAEAPIELAAAVDDAPQDALLIVDCLTVWLANVLVTEAGDGERRADELIAAIGRRRDPMVIVSNEVGLGLVPDNELGRVYRDSLGRLNQRLAAMAATTLLLVAGRAVRLDDPQDLL